MSTFTCFPPLSFPFHIICTTIIPTHSVPKYLGDYVITVSCIRPQRKRCTLYINIQVTASRAIVITDLDVETKAFDKWSWRASLPIQNRHIASESKKAFDLVRTHWRRSTWNTPEHPAIPSQHWAFFALVLWQITAFWHLWKACLPLRQPQSLRHSKSPHPSTLPLRLYHRSAPSGFLPASLPVHDPKAYRCIALPLHSFQAWSCRELDSRGTHAFVREHFEITPRKVEHLLVARRGRAILLSPRKPWSANTSTTV